MVRSLTLRGRPWGRSGNATPAWCRRRCSGRASGRPDVPRGRACSGNPCRPMNATQRHAQSPDHCPESRVRAAPCAASMGMSTREAQLCLSTLANASCSTRRKSSSRLPAAGRTAVLRGSSGTRCRPPLASGCCDGAAARRRSASSSVSSKAETLDDQAQVVIDFLECPQRHAVTLPSRLPSVWIWLLRSCRGRRAGRRTRLRRSVSRVWTSSAACCWPRPSAGAGWLRPRAARNSALKCSTSRKPLTMRQVSANEMPSRVALGRQRRVVAIARQPSEEHQRVVRAGHHGKHQDRPPARHFERRDCEAWRTITAQPPR